MSFLISGEQNKIKDNITHQVQKQEDYAEQLIKAAKAAQEDAVKAVIALEKAKQNALTLKRRAYKEMRHKDFSSHTILMYGARKMWGKVAGRKAGYIPNDELISLIMDKGYCIKQKDGRNITVNILLQRIGNLRDRDAQLQLFFKFLDWAKNYIV